MTVLDSHIAHHRHVQSTRWVQPVDARFDANFWLCAATLAY